MRKSDSSKFNPMSEHQMSQIELEVATHLGTPRVDPGGRKSTMVRDSLDEDM